MDPIEKAIRNAFAKGDPAERAFREKVYRSAFAALDRAIADSPNMTEAIAGRRRQALLAAITAIETEFVPARPAGVAAGAPQQMSPQEPVQPATAEITPEVSPEPPVVPAVSPTLEGERRPVRRQADGASGKLAGGRKAPAGRPRRFRFAGLLATLLLLAGIAAVGWWLVTSAGTGLLPRPQDRAPAPPAAANADALEGWIDIFSPSDPATIAAPGDSRAEVMEDDGQRFMRIHAGASGSPVLFDIGQGVLEQVAGGRAVFNIVARASDGEETQISVECSLGDLGDCGRKRYDVGATREEFLFEIDLAPVRPGSGGTIAIAPGIDGGSRSVDIYAIRVLPAR